MINADNLGNVFCNKFTNIRNKSIDNSITFIDDKSEKFQLFTKVAIILKDESEEIV